MDSGFYVLCKVVNVHVNDHNNGFYSHPAVAQIPLKNL